MTTNNKTYEFQSAEKDDSSVDLQFFVTEEGAVMRQDTWGGKPKRLLGFHHDAHETIQLNLHMEFEVFLTDPQRAVGLYPVFEHEGDVIDDPQYCLTYGHTYPDMVAVVKVHVKEPRHKQKLSHEKKTTQDQS